MIDKIYYLGKKGSNSYVAAKNYFYDEKKLTGVENFQKIFQSVVENENNLGIIPIENSLSGTLQENYDLLDENNIFIVGETCIAINNHLIGKSAYIENVNQVFSHPQALLQCSKFLNQHRYIKTQTTNSTVNAAKYISETGKEYLAAIANEEAAKIYNLKVIKKNIDDKPGHNYTRFFIFSKKKQSINDPNKASFIFTLQHETGSLVKSLKIFAKYGFNLVKIESRPIHGKPFEYIFHVDVTWQKNQLNSLDQLLQELKANTHSIKCLGKYKAAELAF
jgi:chorismate mutase/prephenate dehydratase